MKQLARVADVDGSLHFVACQNPKLDASPFDVKDCPANFVLQFVFDGCRSNEIKLNLKLFCDLVNLFLFVYRRRSLLVLLLPRLILLLADLLRCD